MFTILLVEDHPQVRRALCGLLRPRFRVVEAGSAEDALVHLRGLRPDLVLTDVQLPGMDGLSLTRRIHSSPQTAGVPVVGVSALGAPEDLERARLAGCIDYLVKPITEEVLALLDRLEGLARNGAGRAAAARAP